MPTSTSVPGPRHALTACRVVGDRGRSSPRFIGLSVYRYVAAGVRPKTTVRERCDGALSDLITHTPSLWGIRERKLATADG